MLSVHGVGALRAVIFCPRLYLRCHLISRHTHSHSVASWADSRPPMKSKSKATYDVHDWGIGAFEAVVVETAVVEQIKATRKRNRREGVMRGSSSISEPPRRLARGRRESTADNAKQDSVTRTPGQQQNRPLAARFKSRPQRRKSTSRRGYHSAASLAPYSHSTPVRNWSIPLFSLHSSTCKSLSPPRKPSVAYTRDHDEAEELLQCIPLGQPLGLDLEWNFNPKSGAGYKTALLQICSVSLIVIVQLSAMKKIPPRLRILLQHQGTIKTGVAVKADCTKLAKDYGVRVNGVLELSSVARRAQVDYWASQRRRGLISLQELCRVYLQHDLIKDETRCSDWTRVLTPKQVEYAASDAYVGLEILGRLCGIVDAGWDGEVGQVADKVAPLRTQDSLAQTTEDLALAAFLGEELPTPPRPRLGQSSHDAILLEDSDAEDAISTRKPLAAIETTSRVNAAKSGWFAQPATPTKEKNTLSHPADPPSLTLIKSLLHHNDVSVGTSK